MGNHPLPGYGSVTSGNRLVRTRLPGGVGAEGEIPPATRFATYRFLFDARHQPQEPAVFGRVLRR
jgi:hypothetical protein